MTTTPTLDMDQEDARMVHALLAEYLPGTTVWAYGSRAQGRARAASDLDLVAHAKPDQILQVGDLQEAFEESDLPFRVDLFVWDDLSASARLEIGQAHIVLQA